MASTTTNIGLTKPAGTDQALISAINGNMDIIDTKMGAVGNTSVQSQITSLSDQIANLPTITLTGSNAITTSHTLVSASLVRVANIVVVNAAITLTSNVSAWSNFATINASYKPANPTRGYGDKGSAIIPIYVGTAGNIQLISGGAQSGDGIVFTTVYSLV